MGMPAGARAPLFDDGLEAREALVRERPLLGFDYDGTLAPIVADPARGRMRERTRALFAQVTQRFPCVVVSGRGRADLLRFLDGAAPVAVFGNHGAEGPGDTPPGNSLLDEWRTELDERLETVPGLVIEDKSYTLTLHYRGSPDRGAARARALHASRSLDGVRIVGGVASLNLVPRELPHKGHALARMCEQLERGRALFVGDDATDEDAFAAGPRILGVRVRESERSVAPYYLRGQDEIDALLARLLELHGRWSH